MSWTDYAAAPPPGTPLLAEAELGQVQALELATAAGRFPLLLLRTPAGLRAYVNACPHQYLPLDYHGPQILSADGARLMCTAHGAQFAIETGAALGGADCGLDPVPLALEGGTIVIGRDPPPSQTRPTPTRPG